MGFRIRKSKNFGGLRINLSKTGLGASVGGKGVRFTKKAGGGIRTTVHIPGTGLSYVKDSSKKRKYKKSSNKTSNNEIKILDLYSYNNVELSNKELELFEFLINNFLNTAEFTQADVAKTGFNTTTTYYTKLVNKSLLIKEARGKYSLNTEYIMELYEKYENYLEDLLNRERELKKQKYKILNSICKICSIPMVILGILLLCVDPKIGFISIVIGIEEIILSKTLDSKLIKL